MAWRRDTRPYYVLVSEVMLQQTQVSRVEVKFAAFIDRFPTVEQLAAASLGEVLQVWSGLGYNRRAKFLWQAARMIVADFGGTFPTTKEVLLGLPGVGQNTAGAMLVYAYNQPVVFVETNIRTVFLHHFFLNRNDVADKEIRDKVALTLDMTQPREWYWALMDYGAWLKTQKLGRVQSSKHYKKQSVLAGSQREMRGRILRALAQGGLAEVKLRKIVKADRRFETALDSLSSDGLIERRQNKIQLPS